MSLKDLIYHVVSPLTYSEWQQMRLRLCIFNKMATFRFRPRMNVTYAESQRCGEAVSLTIKCINLFARLHSLIIIFLELS